MKEKYDGFEAYFFIGIRLIMILIVVQLFVQLTMTITMHIRAVFVDAKICGNIIFINKKRSQYQKFIKDLAVKQ